MNYYHQQIESISNQKILTIALILYISMFLIGLVFGIISQSTSLIADSLDILSNTFIYTLGLFAIKFSTRFTTTTALFSGTLLLVLGLFVLVNVVEKFWSERVPESDIMISIASLFLIINIIVLFLLKRFRYSKMHLRVVWIFTLSDVIANTGVILSGILVYITNSRYPDLIVGLAISLYVIKEAIEILQSAYQTWMRK
jgi:cation diffusion facilitator family transporter